MKETIQPTDSVLTIGQLLKNAREKLQLSTDDIADHLRLSNDVVKKIESDQLEKKEITVFIRGYIRSYAKRVNVALERIEDCFLNIGVTNEPQQVAPIDFEFEKPSTKKKRRFRWMSSAIIAFIIFLALIWSFSHYGDSVSINTSSSSISTKTISATALSNTKSKQ